MPNYFIDSTTGNNADSGLTMDLAWATLEYAAESGGLAAADKIWIRRLHAETPTSDIVCAYDGTVAAPISFIGCPRTTHAITSSDWTNGNTSVTVDDADMDREQHMGRYITGPDSEIYLITRVVNATTITIDREYAGATVTNQAATISADEDYALFNAIDDSGWTINKAAWNADADDLPSIDFNGGAFQFVISGSTNHTFKNLQIRESADANGSIYVDNVSQFTNFIGCLFAQDQNQECGYIPGDGVLFRRCIFEGNSTGSGQRGLLLYGQTRLEDCAIYGFGDDGLNVYAPCFFKNVNIGVEVANGDYDIRIYQTEIVGFDVKLGSTNTINIQYPKSKASFENYQKVLGSNRTIFYGGFYENATLTGATTPNKKTSDDVLKITPNVNNHASNNPDTAYKVGELRVWSDAASHDYKYWIYNNMSATINDTTATDNLFIKVSYVTGYDDTSEYQYTSTYSAQIDIAAAADATDWDYVEVTGVTPAVAGWVIIEFFVSMYSATGTIFIDPEKV